MRCVVGSELRISGFFVEEWHECGNPTSSNPPVIIIYNLLNTFNTLPNIPV